MDRITALQVFIDIANTENFSTTATRLNLSRAMVTRYVKQLEQWLNVRLFQRTTRKVSLTPAGQDLLKTSKDLIDMIHGLESWNKNPDGQLRGQLRVACSISFAHAFMAEALAGFSTLHPGLHIHLDVEDNLKNLLDHHLDLAIRITNQPHPGLVNKKLGDCQSILVASPAYLELYGEIHTPNELTKHQYLGHTNIGRRQLELSQQGKVLAVQLEPRFTSNEVQVLLQASKAGLGICLLPDYLANEPILRGDLCRVLQGWQTEKFGIHAQYPSRKHLAPAVRKLLDYLAQQLVQVYPSV